MGQRELRKKTWSFKWAKKKPVTFTKPSQMVVTVKSKAVKGTKYVDSIEFPT
jgi:hypothetical protein